MGFADIMLAKAAVHGIMLPSVNNTTEERRGTRGAFEIWKNVNLSTRDAS